MQNMLITNYKDKYTDVMSWSILNAKTIKIFLYTQGNHYNSAGLSEVYYFFFKKKEVESVFCPKFQYLGTYTNRHKKLGKILREKIPANRQQRLTYATMNRQQRLIWATISDQLHSWFYGNRGIGRRSDLPKESSHGNVRGNFPCHLVSIGWNLHSVRVSILYE